MAHYSRLRMIVIDVPGDDHTRELAFWQGAVGRELAQVERHPEYHGALLPAQQQLGLLVQRLDQGAARVHLDFHTDDLAAEVARLERLGATRVDQVHDWQIMRDPAGLLFCVIPVKASSLDDSNAQRWE